MSEVICKGCNRRTITSLSMSPSEKEATECYVALKNGLIVKGCGYEHADTLYKELADKYLQKRQFIPVGTR
jgi:hypothetical protein